MGFLAAQLVKNLLAVRETGVLSLGQEDALEKETETHASTPVSGEFREQRSWAGYSPPDRRVGHDCVKDFHPHFISIWLLLNSGQYGDSKMSDTFFMSPKICLDIYTKNKAKQYNCSWIYM